MLRIFFYPNIIGSQAEQAGLPPPIVAVDMSSEKIESEQHLLRLLAAEEETATAKAATDVGHQMAVDQVHTISDQLKTQLVNIPPLTVQVNSLAPGKFELNFRYVIFKQILVIDGWDRHLQCKLTHWPLGNLN